MASLTAFLGKASSEKPKLLQTKTHPQSSKGELFLRFFVVQAVGHISFVKKTVTWCSRTSKLKNKATTYLKNESLLWNESKSHGQLIKRRNGEKFSWENSRRHFEQSVTRNRNVWTNFRCISGTMFFFHTDSNSNTKIL